MYFIRLECINLNNLCKKKYFNDFEIIHSIKLAFNSIIIFFFKNNLVEYCIAQIVNNVSTKIRKKKELFIEYSMIEIMSKELKLKAIFYLYIVKSLS